MGAGAFTNGIGKSVVMAAVVAIAAVAAVACLAGCSGQAADQAPARPAAGVLAVYRDAGDGAGELLGYIGGDGAFSSEPCTYASEEEASQVGSYTGLPLGELSVRFEEREPVAAAVRVGSPHEDGPYELAGYIGEDGSLRDPPFDFASEEEVPQELGLPLGSVLLTYEPAGAFSVAVSLPDGRSGGYVGADGSLSDEPHVFQSREEAGSVAWELPRGAAASCVAA